MLSCVENKYKELLLITGKGMHSTNDNDAYVKDGGEGAILIKLKNL